MHSAKWRIWPCDIFWKVTHMVKYCILPSRALSQVINFWIEVAINSWYIIKKNKLLILQIACFFIIFWSGYRVLDGFLFDDQTQIYESCSAVLNGNMLVFGGSGDYSRQWSSVASCSLRSEGKLDFDFYHGACNTIQVKFFRSYK